MDPIVEPRRFWPALRGNLFAGLRALLFRRVTPSDFEVTFEQVAALFGVALVVAVVLDRVGATPDDQLVPANLYTWSALALIGLWACALIARVSKPRVETRALLVAALSTAPWALIVACACSFVPALSDSSGLLLIVAVLIVLWGSVCIVRAVCGSLKVPALIVIGATVVVVGLVDNYLYFDPHLWEQVAADDDESTGWQDAEATFYDQPGLIDESLRKLAPERPGVTDLYYVGFAGDGDQRVFRREALLGQQVFAARMGTGSRSLELVNDREARTDFPLATVTGLRYALSGIGRIMDPKEDILVLFLTSHGSREGGIFVRTGVTPIDNDLPPDDVRSALDDAGIRWRIVIVSACYAGVFVEPLKSDTTMVITAADALHTSFGCEDDRNLTYFGEAFLRDSLSRAPSLEAAFEQARREIAERETREKLTPSDPQMWVGASMSRKLAQLGSLPLAAPVPTSLTK